MATVTWNVSKDSLIAYSTFSMGAGAEQHMPIGLQSGYKIRGLLGFSYSFSGMVAINSATLYCKTSASDVHLTKQAGAEIYVARLLGSWSEGTAGENAWSATNAVEWDNQPTTSATNRQIFTVTGADATWDSQSITGIIRDAFNAGVFYGLKLWSTNEDNSNNNTEFLTSEYGTSHDAYIVVDYSTNTAPTAPTSPSPTADALINSLTPTFSATFADPDLPSEAMAAAQVIVYNDDGITLKWDSGEFAATGATFSRLYAGSALTGNTFYRWKGRTKDDGALWGPYTALQRFKVNSAPSAPTISITQTPTTSVKTLTPTFNVTHNDPDPSDSQLYGYQIVLETSAGTAVWDSGETASTATTTKSVTYPGSPTLAWQTGYRWKAKTQDSNGAWGPFSSYATFTTYTTTQPVGHYPSGGVVAASTAPTLSAQRGSTDDSLVSASVYVYAEDGTTLIWSSVDFTSGVSSTGFSIVVGTTLVASTTYKWMARVTGVIGGTSSAAATLQTFITPSASQPSGTTPLGAGFTDLTPDITFTRGTNFNRHQLYVYGPADNYTSPIFTDEPVAYTAAGSKTVTCTTTLSWATTYKWKVRVSADGGSNWSDFTGLLEFSTDSAGVPAINAPVSDEWLGAPEVIDGYGNLTGITNGTSASTSIDTTDKQTGRGSLKIALTTLATGTTSETYRTVTRNLSKYGKKTPIKIWVKASTLTNLSSIRVRFTFATVNDYVEYAITPSGTGWEQKTLTLDTSTAAGGTANWSNVTRVGIRVTSVTSTYTGNVSVDDLKFDASAPSFDLTTFNSEVVSTFDIIVYSDAAGTNAIWTSTGNAGSGTTYSKIYGGSALAAGTAYYWKSRYVKSTGPTGGYTPLTAFTLNSAPNAPASLVPVNGAIVADDLSPTFESSFSDTDRTTRGDTPTIYEVEVYRNSDSVLVYSLLKDADLIGGTNSVTDGDAGILKTTGAANPIAYETEYKYRSRYTDSMGATGAWSNYISFKPTQSPTTTISSPADAGTVSSPSFTTTWAMSSPGSKGQNSYQLSVVRSDIAVTVYDTGRVYSSSVSFALPSGYLINSTEYVVSVRTWDTDGLVSAYDTATVTTTWTAPAAIEGFTVTDDVSRSAIILEWEASALLSTDFRKYVIYRKRVGQASWSVLLSISTQSTVEYLDYNVANTVGYDYKITQYKVVPGDVDIESGDSDISTVTLDTDSWMVVGADRASSHIFELPVASAPFVEPVQQEVFEPLGTSRKVIIRGKVLGAEGSMQCKWKDSERDMAVSQVEYIKSNAGPHILKSPFGDIWYVEFSAPSKEYIGGGHMNVMLVWTEVE